MIPIKQKRNMTEYKKERLKVITGLYPSLDKKGYLPNLKAIDISRIKNTKLFF